MVAQTCGENAASDENRSMRPSGVSPPSPHAPMECMSPLSTFALSRLDMAKTVQWRREARRRDIPRFRPPTTWPSSSTSLQSFSRFMKSVKYLESTNISQNINPANIHGQTPGDTDNN